MPFTVLGAVHLVASVIVTGWLISHPPAQASPWLCQGCGYLLYGVRSPTCPECGHPVPAAIRQDAPR